MFMNESTVLTPNPPAERFPEYPTALVEDRLKYYALFLFGQKAGDLGYNLIVAFAKGKVVI